MNVKRWTVATAVAALALAGCSSEPSMPPVWSQPVQQPDVQVDPDPIYGEQALNERRNLVKELGQPGAITNSDGSILVDFAVTNIQPVECGKSSLRGYPTENGRFLLVDVVANTYDDPDDMLVAVSLGYGWEFVAEADGTATDANTGAAAVCASDVADDSQPQLKPNRKYTAQFVLDVPNTQGVVTWSLGWTSGNAGWEWAAPPVQP